MIRFEYLGLVYGVSEMGMALRKRGRRREGARSHDAGTLRLVWFAILVGLVASLWIANSVALGHQEACAVLRTAELSLFVGGIALRWWAILVLGRFFTVDVAIHADHTLVTRGPYQYLRHPSYTGVLLAFVGLGLALGNWLALAALLVPIVTALLVRIRVEERALSERFGDAWGEHAKRTWRLVPFVW